MQKYCGREQHIEAYDERRDAIVVQTEALRATIAALAACLWPVLRLTRLPAADLLRVFANER